MQQGGGDYFELRQVSLAGGPIFYCEADRRRRLPDVADPFVFIMTMVVLNMLIAIIMDT